VNPHSELIPVARVGGVTSVITAAGGGLISGYAALVDLTGWTPQEMSVVPQAGLVVTYPRVAGGRRGGQGSADHRKQVNRQVEQLTEYFRSARTTPSGRRGSKRAAASSTAASCRWRR
jgi:hypothetical protein